MYRIFIIAAGALLGDAVYASQLIINSGTSNECDVLLSSNVTLDPSTGNLLTTGTLSGAGCSGGVVPGAPVFAPALAAAPLTVAPGNSTTLTFGATSTVAVSCTGSVSPTTNIVSPNPWLTGGALCNSQATCLSVSSLVAFTAAATGAYNFRATCTNSSGSTLSPPTGFVTVNVVTAGQCSTTTHSPDVPSFTRQCIGGVGFHAPQGGPPNYSGDLSEFAEVWGAFPGTIIGYTADFALQPNQFVALAFVPTANHTIKLTGNQTYTDHNNTISISTTPGALLSGALCTESRGSSNSLQISDSGMQSNCAITAGTTYYVNIANVSAVGASTCSTFPCDTGYQLQILQ